MQPYEFLLTETKESQRAVKNVTKFYIWRSLHITCILAHNSGLSSSCATRLCGENVTTKPEVERFPSLATASTASPRPMSEEVLKGGAFTYDVCNKALTKLEVQVAKGFATSHCKHILL